MRRACKESDWPQLGSYDDFLVPASTWQAIIELDVILINGHNPAEQFAGEDNGKAKKIGTEQPWSHEKKTRPTAVMEQGRSP